MRKAIRRGDLFYADLNPVVGSEQGGIRPAVWNSDRGQRGTANGRCGHRMDAGGDGADMLPTGCHHVRSGLGGQRYGSISDSTVQCPATHATATLHGMCRD